MKAKEWRFDKCNHLRPVADEPDKAQWLDDETGLPCLILRNGMGALCGYVGVPKGHPLFEVNYAEVGVDVHGGLTFSNHCRGEPDGHSICHLVEEGEDDVWWLGFDCAHGGDFVPGLANLGGMYRDLTYVKSEIKSLAKQIADYCE